MRAAARAPAARHSDDRRSVRPIGRTLPTLGRWSWSVRSAGSASRAAVSSPTSTARTLVELTPDREHPVTKGFACHKGLAAVDVNHDPDRLDRPLLRVADGSWTTVGWDDAIAHTAARLQAISGEHGPNAISAYIGNPTAFNALASLHVGALLRALGVRRTFSSGTQDCANKFVASEAVFGSSTVHPIPDLEHTDLCLIIGENPRASQASFYSIPNVLGELRRATGRGARIVFVNPRRIETPERGVGDTVLIRPDTDVWFLAAPAPGDRPPRRVRRRRARPPRSPRRGAAGVPRRLPADAGRRRHRCRRRRDRASWRRRGSPRRGHRCTPRPASTWAARGRSPTGSCTCWRSSPAASTPRAGTSRATASTPTPGPAPASPEQAYVDTEFGRLRRGALPGTLMADADPRQRRPGAGDDRRRRQPAAVDRRRATGCARPSSSSSCSS